MNVFRWWVLGIFGWVMVAGVMADVNYRVGLGVPIAAFGVWLFLRAKRISWEWKHPTPGGFTPEDLLATFEGEDLARLDEDQLKMRQMAIDAIRYRPRWAAIRYATTVAALALSVGLLTGAL